MIPKEVMEAINDELLIFLVFMCLFCLFVGMTLLLVCIRHCKKRSRQRNNSGICHTPLESHPDTIIQHVGFTEVYGGPQNHNQEASAPMDPSPPYPTDNFENVMPMPNMLNKTSANQQNPELAGPPTYDEVMSNNFYQRK